MQTNKWYYIFFCACLLLLSCHSNTSDNADENVKAETPVKVATVTTGPMISYIDVNATSAFLQKNIIKANANGYIQSVNTQVGKYVSKGQQLFSIKTKEAASIGNTISKLDPSFHFSGINHIIASGNGYVTQLDHQAGDYVQDGEQLAVISDKNSFVFIMDLPYELRTYLNNQKQVQLILPDSTKLQGTIASVMPSVDPATQAQRVVIQVPQGSNIPENLVAKVRLVKTAALSAVSVPRAAILTNDEQNEFWVMKMIDSNTAVKVPVKTGIETGDAVEVLSPVFSASDKILISGNYGLSDTAKVKVTNE